MINVIFFPKNFKKVIFKNKTFSVFLGNDFFYILINLGLNIKINRFTNTIQTQSRLTKFFKELKDFFNSYSSINLDVIKFKGKGYKLTKQKNTMDFLFNFAHMNYFVARETLMIKTYKSKFAILNTNKSYLDQLKKDIRSIRSIDKYTYNGLRVKRQLVYKRKGKTLST